MASFTLEDTGDRFPDGTVALVYRASARREGLAPSGASVTAATVTGGSVTFTGLLPDIPYVAYAEVAGLHRYISFRTFPEFGLLVADRTGSRSNARRVAPGADGQVLVRDSTKVEGVAWATIGTGGGEEPPPDGETPPPVVVTAGGFAVAFHERGSVGLEESDVWLAPFAATKLRLTLTVRVAPVGSSLDVEYLHNGTAVWVASVPAGSTQSASHTISKTVAVGDELSVRASSVGSTTAAVGVVAQIVGS